MSKIIVIKADVNDADYVTNITKISDERLLKIKPVIDAIRACKERHNYKDAEDLYGHISGFNLFEEYVPYGTSDCDEVHTIETISVYEVVSETQLL